MANNIRLIQDNSGNNVFPITHERAVRDGDGVTLETKLSAINMSIDGGELETKSAKDVSGLTNESRYIMANGTWNSGSNSRGKFVPIVAGKKYSVKYTNLVESSAAHIGILKSNSMSIGSTADFATGYSARIVLSLNEEYSFVAPSDAAYLFILTRYGSTTYYTYTVYEYGSTHVAGLKDKVEDIEEAIEHIEIDPVQTIDKSVKAGLASVGVVADGVFNGEGYDTEVVDLSSITSESPSFGASSFNSAGYFKKFYVNPGDVVAIEGNATYDGTCAFALQIGCPNSGGSSGVIELCTVKKAEITYFRAPSSAVAFMFNTSDGTNDISPSSITVYRVKDSESFRVIPCLRFAASSGSLIYAAYSSNRNVLVRVKAGHTYLLKPQSNASGHFYFTDELPKVGATATGIFSYSVERDFLDSSNVFTPAMDGYVFGRVYKSSSPELSVSVTEVFPDITSDKTSLVLENRTAQLVKQGLIWQRQVINAFTFRPYAILADTGKYGGADNYKHILVPVTPGQYVKISPNPDNSTVIAFLTSDDAPVAYGLPAYVSGTGRMSFANDSIVQIPSGAKYMYVYMGQSPYIYTPSYLGLSMDETSLPHIVQENDYLKTKRILDQLVSRTRDERDTDTANKPLVLLHYSDIHGSTVCQRRINQYREFWKGYIDDTIQTGDLLEDRWTNDSPFGDDTDPENPNRDILCIIGNHDTATGTGDNRNWHDKQGKEAYDRFFAPFIANWDVVQPTDAATNGYCFYYKDYTAQHIRLIALDAWNSDATYNTTQLAWLIDVLDDALENGLSVLMASHFALQSEMLIKTTFSKPGAAVENPDTSSVNNPYKSAVKDFIDGGGELIGWICGHSHYDAVTRTSTEQGGQISIRVGNASRHYSSANTLYITNSLIEVVPDDYKTQDLFNIMAVDTTYKTITLFRVGSEWDKFGRKIETSCIKYTTGEVIY